jgi:hypothetical protein
MHGPTSPQFRTERDALIGRRGQWRWPRSTLPRWIGVLVALKGLVLAEYRIEFHGLSVALVGALVLAKVALVLELGASIRTRPALVDVVLRTALYAVGVLVGLVLEKAARGAARAWRSRSALMAVFQHAEVHHVWVNTIRLSGVLLGYNVMSVIRRHIGEGELVS